MRNWEQCSDRDLLVDARTNAEPFGVFYERYFASVLAFFRRRVPGPEEAFDLTAETFAAALSSVPRFEPGPEPPRAWLFTIARHKLSEALRSSRIQDEARHALAMQPIHFVETTSAPATSAGRAPRHPAPSSAKPGVAHHVEERGYMEIATELRCSESVVRKRVSRGLAVMRAQLRNGEA